MHVHIHTHAQPFKAQHDCWSLGSSVLKLFTFATKCCDMCQNLYICMYTHEHMLNLSKHSMNVGGLAPAFCNFHFCHKMPLSFFLRPFFFQFLLPLFFQKPKFPCHGCQTSGFISSLSFHATAARLQDLFQASDFCQNTSSCHT